MKETKEDNKKKKYCFYAREVETQSGKKKIEVKVSEKEKADFMIIKGLKWPWILQGAYDSFNEAFDAKEEFMTEKGMFFIPRNKNE